MGHRKCFAFGERNLDPAFLKGKDVIEVGACEDGGSMRGYVMAGGPSRYVGIDIQAGPGVDEICDAMEMLDKFGPESFDVLIANELLERIRDWRRLVHVFKNVLRPHGIMILTTRSKGFPFHHAPFDYWRYEPEDMAAIFRDFEILGIESDPRRIAGKVTPGVFVAAQKPSDFQQCSLDSIQLYSILNGRRIQDVSSLDILRYELLQLPSSYWRRHWFLPFAVRSFLSTRVMRPVRNYWADVVS